MAQKQLRSDIYEATSTFSIGARIIRRGDTVAAGHPYMKGREVLFRPFRPTYGELPSPTPEAKPEPVAAPAPEVTPEPETPEVEPAAAEQAGA